MAANRNVSTTTPPWGQRETLMGLVRSWEAVASEFRARATESKTAAGVGNAECCRSMSVALETAARELRKVIGVSESVPPPSPDATEELCPATTPGGTSP